MALCILSPLCILRDLNKAENSDKTVPDLF